MLSVHNCANAQQRQNFVWMLNLQPDLSRSRCKIGRDRKAEIAAIIINIFKKILSKQNHRVVIDWMLANGAGKIVSLGNGLCCENFFGRSIRQNLSFFHQ